MSDFDDEMITQSRVTLQDPYAHLNGEGEFEAVIYDGKSERCVARNRLRSSGQGHQPGDDMSAAFGCKGPKAPSPFRVNLDGIRDPSIVGKRISFEEIEGIAKKLQNSIWRNRKEIWRDNLPDNPLDVLDPAIAFKLIGYNFGVDDNLGEISTAKGPVPVAGLIDKSESYAGVSSRIPLAVRQFTAAHELAHAVLHHAVGLHRDRALDGSPVSGPRDRVEVEADKFAAYFLIPARLLTSEFKARFGLIPFVVDDDTSFWLIGSSSSKLRRRYRNLRDLSRVLAAAEKYSGNHFESLSERFRVSTEAMAIRLEELELLKF